MSDTLALPTTATSTTAPVHMPQLAFGTYLSPPSRTLASCLAALASGYRHIDTAQYYENEAEVGQAIRQSSSASGLAREDIFVTTKILKVAPTADENYAACLESVDKIGGYVDLFLIHSPRGGPDKRRAMWQALERLYDEGKARAIGLSNFGIGQIEELKGAGQVWPPHVNQIEVSESPAWAGQCPLYHLSDIFQDKLSLILVPCHHHHHHSYTPGTNKKKSSHTASRTASPSRPTAPSSGT